MSNGTIVKKKSKNPIKRVYKDDGVQRAAAGVAVAAIVALTKSVLFDD